MVCKFHSKNNEDGSPYTTKSPILCSVQILAKHVNHLRIVFESLRTASLKLNPAKCRFVCDEVEYVYLGHLITPAGLILSEQNLIAVKEFPVPTN